MALYLGNTLVQLRSGGKAYKLNIHGETVILQLTSSDFYSLRDENNIPLLLGIHLVPIVDLASSDPDPYMLADSENVSLTANEENPWVLNRDLGVSDYDNLTVADGTADGQRIRLKEDT